MCVYVLRHACSRAYHGVLVEAGEQFGGVGSLLPSYELLGSKSLHLAWQQASLPTEPAPRPLQVRRLFFSKPENPFLYCSKHVSCLRTKASALSISCWAHISGVLGQWAEHHLSLLAIVTLSSATLVAPLQTDAALLTFFIPAFSTRICSKGSHVIFVGVESSGWQKASALHLSVRSLLVSLVPAPISFTLRGI